jgi:hypothetical protein
MRGKMRVFVIDGAIYKQYHSDNNATVTTTIVTIARPLETLPNEPLFPSVTMRSNEFADGFMKNFIVDYKKCCNRLAGSHSTNLSRCADAKRFFFPMEEEKHIPREGFLRFFDRLEYGKNTKRLDHVRDHICLLMSRHHVGDDDPFFVVGDDETLQHLHNLKYEFPKLIPLPGLLHLEINSCEAIYLICGPSILYPLAEIVGARNIVPLKREGNKKTNIIFHQYEEFLNSVIIEFYNLLETAKIPENIETFNPNLAEMIFVCTHLFVPWLLLRGAVRAANWDLLREAALLFLPIFLVSHKTRYFPLVVRLLSLHQCVNSSWRKHYEAELFAALTPHSVLAVGADDLAERYILNSKQALGPNQTEERLRKLEEYWNGIYRLRMIAKEQLDHDIQQNHISLPHRDEIRKALEAEFLFKGVVKPSTTQNRASFMFGNREPIKPDEIPSQLMTRVSETITNEVRTVIVNERSVRENIVKQKEEPEFTDKQKQAMKTLDQMAHLVPDKNSTVKKRKEPPVEPLDVRKGTRKRIPTKKDEDFDWTVRDE